MPRPSTLSELIGRPNFFFSAPEIAPRTVCGLCRCRHKAHTIRGAMAGALKKKLGLTITSEKVAGRGRVYSIKLPG